MRRAHCRCFTLQLWQRAFTSQPSVSDDHSKFLKLVNLCAERKLLHEATSVYSSIQAQGILLDGFFGASVVRMFIKCRSIHDASRVFEQMLDRSMVLWTSMVTAFVDDEDVDRAWLFFFRMQLEGVLPDRVTFISILNACESLAQGELVHRLIVDKNLESDVVIGNALMKMLAKCYDLDGAARFFQRMPRRDVISWTGMVTAYARNGHIAEAFGYYLRMLLEGVVPNNITFLAVLAACSSARDADLVYGNVVEAEWETDTMVANASINMFSKCGCLDRAHDVFHRMKRWDVKSWNAMVAALAQHGFSSEALELFRRMPSEVAVDKTTLVIALSTCAAPESLEDGKSIHSRVARLGLETDVVAGTALVTMYSRCGDLGEARRVFDGILGKNVVSWNNMIAAYGRDESLHSRALEIFRLMLLDGVRPTRTTALNVVSAVECQSVGKQLHGWIVDTGLYSDSFIGSALVNMYERTGSLGDARRVFEKIIERDVFAWNAIVGVCVGHGQPREALEWFSRMLLEGASGNRATFLLALSAVSPDRVSYGRKLHGLIAESGLEADNNVANALISMYARCKSLEDARNTFDRLEDKSIVSWTSVIAACVDLGSCQEAIDLFQRMELEPDRVTFTTVLEACTIVSAHREGKLVHSRARELGLESNVFVATALIHMHSKFGNLGEARRIFEAVEAPTLACWNAMLGGYAQTGHSQSVIDFFHAMQQRGVAPDHITFLAVVSACSHAGLVEKGARTFASMGPDYGVGHGLEDYGCLIDLLARAGQLEEAYDFLQGMPCGPSDVTWKTLLAACKIQGDVRRGSAAARSVIEREPYGAAAFVELSYMSSIAGEEEEELF
ncbi:hypothetical protein SELMODRAFT_124816 [Selaginella moellendorffii]|uniref:Pentacotripeptide-repeat region of PRORP domain-containing protein n=1 Tax=Selaginella moellendorffii TaxID=88036 RepID=D8SU13_SELML|nr:pentatricopeptide repeat-containing protein At3g53360, mitochondrial [Selaginella moellendorffii]EFJ12173.1 hypothetical protein SELMODRAFT_124816 [Selaginella moellendorffii]|eukprot:XP_002986843.1 pentatricopeptide repeat-containing protein At3g53360, mitochondrial [Selaginella moellendorffii]